VAQFVLQDEGSISYPCSSGDSMAKAKQKAPRRLRRRRNVVAVRASSDRAVVVELLKEMHHLVLDAAEELGVTAKDAKHAMELAARDSRRSRPSEPIMKVNYGIAILLYHWRNDKRYQRPEGTPRVLSIHGKGATFETLARTYVPTIRLNALIDMVCENAEVTRLNRGKIALVGSPVMMTPKTREITLAALASRLRRLTSTIVHNASLPAKMKSNNGRFERIVTGELTEREFREFAQTVRQPMQDLCDRVDAGLRQSVLWGRARAKERLCGVGLYVYRDDGEIG
jgi:hypothetical protein